jgi:hypothetical protein
MIFLALSRSRRQQASPHCKGALARGEAAMISAITGADNAQAAD